MSSPRAYITLAEASIAFLHGRWRDAHAHYRAAEQMLRECVGVAWEIATANVMSLFYLLHIGAFMSCDLG